MKADRRRVRWGYVVVLFLLLGADVEVGCWFLFGNWRDLGPTAWVYLAAFTALALTLIAHLHWEAWSRE